MHFKGADMCVWLNEIKLHKENTADARAAEEPNIYLIKHIW